MNLVTVREIYKEREKYLNQQIQVGGWVRSIRDSKTFGLIPSRLSIMTPWIIFLISAS